MNDEVRRWLRYADENLQSAKLLLDHGLFNPCLQNAQQAVEKSLKAVLVKWAIPLRRTHSIDELMKILTESGVLVDLPEEECELLDSIYIPSKYPLGSALPDFEPDEEVCRQCLRIAETTMAKALTLVEGD